MLAVDTKESWHLYVLKKGLPDKSAPDKSAPVKSAQTKAPQSKASIAVEGYREFAESFLPVRKIQ